MKTKHLLIPLRGLNQNDALPQRADGGMEVLHQLTYSDGGCPDDKSGDSLNNESGDSLNNESGCSLNSDGCSLRGDGCSLSGESTYISDSGWTEGGLMGVGLTAVKRIAIGSGYHLKGEHRTAAYHHLLLERQTGATYHYAWTDADAESGAPHPIILPDDSQPVNSLVSVGDILCLVYDDDTLYALWQPDTGDYTVVTRSQLGYDLLIGQDQQQHVAAEVGGTDAKGMAEGEPAVEGLGVGKVENRPGCCLAR